MLEPHGLPKKSRMRKPESLIGGPFSPKLELIISVSLEIARSRACTTGLITSQEKKNSMKKALKEKTRCEYVQGFLSESGKRMIPSLNDLIKKYRAFMSDEDKAYLLWDLSDESLADDQDIHSLMIKI